MSRDFTYQRYEELCRGLAESGYRILQVREFLEKPDSGTPTLILRHDVDRHPEKASIFAGIEHRHGLRASYYFRFTRDVFDADLIKGIARLGHEIGYHYEVVDKARGNLGRAAELFDQELAVLRHHVPVDTACMHGNPLTRNDNLALWTTNEPGDHGLAGDCTVSFASTPYLYLSDTGRNWSPRHGNLKDCPPTATHCDAPITDSRHLIAYLNDCPHHLIQLNIHPSHWSTGGVEWLRQWAGQTAKNTGKEMLRCVGVAGRR